MCYYIFSMKVIVIILLFILLTILGFLARQKIVIIDASCTSTETCTYVKETCECIGFTKKLNYYYEMYQNKKATCYGIKINCTYSSQIAPYVN